MVLLGITTASWGWSRQVQRGSIDHINPISATRMMPVPTPVRNNPTSACMSHQSASRNHSTVGEVFVDASLSEGWLTHRRDHWSFRIASVIAEARLQATDDFRFEAPPGNGRFLSQPMMEVLGQPQTDHPTPRALHQRKASDNSPNHQANNQSGNGGNGDGHGDTPPIIRPYLQSRSYPWSQIG
jgi:hypothetical protein